MPQYGKKHHSRSLAPETIYRVHNPSTGESVPVNALVDTGAAMTIIPESALDNLGEVTIYSSKKFKFANGEIQRRTTYIVNVTVEGKDENNIEVLALDKEHGLIGRDILNKHKIVLNAPRGQWSMGACDSPCLFPNENES